MFFFGGQIIHAQNSIEDTNSIMPIDPIWVIAELNDSILDFSSIDLTNYSSDETFDFNRYSNQSFFQQTMFTNDSTFFSFNGVSINVDNVNYHFTGNAIVIPICSETLIHNEDTLPNLRKLNLIENYFLLDDMNDTVATYNNEYYCFVDQSGVVHFEIYDKRRTIKNIQTESFVGVGVNDFMQQSSSIGLFLNPNPNSTTLVTANFSLPVSGNINISISNQIGTINDLIYSSNLSAGTNSVPLDISNYPSGSYGITVYYNYQNYSQTLIKQ